MASFAASCRALLGERHCDLVDLDAALDGAHAAATSAWPELAVPAERFAERVVAAIAGEADPRDALAKLHAADLYLALACADGNAAALAVVERELLPDLRGALGRMGLATAAIDEALQVTREELLVARPDGPARIANYAGRGPLRAWLRSVAARAGLRQIRDRDRAGSSLGDQLAAPDDDIELAYLKRTYGEAFRAAFREALGKLDAADRVLLKQRFRHNVGVEELGAMHGVHASTISRRVATARDRLVALTRKAMIEALRIDRDELDSILRLIESQVDISLSSDVA